MITLSFFLVLHTDNLFLFIYLFAGMYQCFFFFIFNKKLPHLSIFRYYSSNTFLKNHLSFIVSPTTPIEKDMSQRLSKGTLCQIMSK